MAIHEEVLAAARRIGRDRRDWTFRPDEIVRVLPHLNAGTVRTHVTSRCCVNAPRTIPTSGTTSLASREVFRDPADVQNASRHSRGAGRIRNRRPFETTPDDPLHTEAFRGRLSCRMHREPGSGTGRYAGRGRCEPARNARGQAPRRRNRHPRNHAGGAPGSATLTQHTRSPHHHAESTQRDGLGSARRSRVVVKHAYVPDAGDLVWLTLIPREAANSAGAAQP